MNHLPRPTASGTRAVRSLIALGLSLLFLGSAVASIGQAAGPAQRRETSPCGCETVKTVAPDTIRECDTSQVTVTLAPACPGTRIHIVYIVDEVYKVGYSEPNDRLTALRNSVNRLELRKNPHIQVGVVWMQRGTAIKRLDLTNDETAIIGQLSPPPVSRFEASPQCFDCGFNEAGRVLDRGQRENPGVEIEEIVLLAPLGVYTPGAAPGVTRGASRAKARPATVISTCFAWTHCDPVLRRAASEPRLYLAYGEGNRLAALVHDVVRSSVSTFLRKVQLSEILPDSLEMVPGSANIEPTSIDPDTGAIVWEIEDAFEVGMTVTYRVRPLDLGVIPVGEASVVELTDSVYRAARIPIPAPLLTVTERCLSPPTPTSTPTDTPEPTATDVPPTETPTPTVTPSPTPKPGPIFLPLAVNERCRPDKLRADIVLVIDTSTSMRERTRGGRTKMAAAADAARLLLARLDLEPDDAGKADQAAIVAFNREARVAVRLGRDRAALMEALDALPIAMTTRLDLGLRAGYETLFGEGRDPRNKAVLIVLTDGRANPMPATDALPWAEKAKAEGAILYVVGLGPDVERDVLRRLASDPGLYRPAPDGDDLAVVYLEVTEDIACRSDPFWPRPGP